MCTVHKLDLVNHPDYDGVYTLATAATNLYNSTGQTAACIDGCIYYRSHSFLLYYITA